MSGLWLHLGHLENMETSLTKFDSVVAEDALTLEGLRVLGLRREQSVGRECLRLEENATLANHIAKMEEYLAILTAFTSTTKHSGPVSRAGFRWSSALSSLPPSSHFGLDSALAEQIMALSFYAALLQERAYELANQLLRAGSMPSSPAAVPGAGGGGSGRSSPDRRRTSEHRAVGLRRWSYSPSKEGGPAENGAGAAGSGGADDSGEAFAQVAALYRRAAGAFRHIDQQLFEAAAASGLPSDRPVELWEGAAAAMEALCLAQAQGVVAHRAELKGTSAPLVAALYTGAADLWEAASAKLRAIKAADPKRSLSDRVRRYLAISATLAQAKALRALAHKLRAEHELGQAVAALARAIVQLRQACAVCEKDADWLAALGPELAALEQLHAACDRERQVVYYQPLAALAPALPAGKVIVAALPYETPAADQQAYF